MKNEKDLKKKYNNDDRGCPRGKLEADNWLAGISDSKDYPIVEVSFKNTRIGFYDNSDRLDLKIGDIVAVEGNPGHDVGRVTMVGRLVKRQMIKNGIKSESDFKKIFRIATPADIEKYDEARSKEHSTMIRARKIAEELSLNMKIGDVEYQGDGGKAIFYYIADERVDFRKLIRILADTFKVRIEMKQIGARQEAGRIGGIGPCGRQLCCSSWMTHFVSVGTGAARIQDLSMNPQKLAGQCAKLKCCLNFETDVYYESQKKLPPRDVVLETKDGDYYYFKPDILAGLVTYSTDRKIPSNLVTITARRAFEIMALNKAGIKADRLEGEGEEVEESEKEYGDLLDEQSLTRFDKSKKKSRRKKGGERKSENVQNNGSKDKGESQSEPSGRERSGGREKRHQGGANQSKEKRGERRSDRRSGGRHDRRHRSEGGQKEKPENKSRANDHAEPSKGDNC